MSNQQEEDLDQAMMDGVSRFVRTPPAKAPPTSPQIIRVSHREEPSGSLEAATAVSEETASLSSDSLVTEANPFLAAMPHEALSKRAYKHCLTAVSRWIPPEDLSKRDVEKFRHAALMSRVSSLVDTAAKLQLGLLLIESKERLKHGHFVRYVEDACGLPRRRASELMAVAKTFTDHRLVLTLGYEFCQEVSQKAPPQIIIDRITNAPDRLVADQIFEHWQQDQRITDAFAGLPIEKPLEAFGREIALDLSSPHVVRDLRQFAIGTKEPEKVRDLLNIYHAKLAEGKDGSTAFLEATGAEQNKSLSPRRLHLKNLNARVEALSRYQETVVSEQAEALAKEIEDKLLELEQLIQSNG